MIYDYNKKTNIQRGYLNGCLFHTSVLTSSELFLTAVSVNLVFVRTSNIITMISNSVNLYSQKQ